MLLRLPAQPWPREKSWGKGRFAQPCPVLQEEGSGCQGDTRKQAWSFQRYGGGSGLWLLGSPELSLGSPGIISGFRKHGIKVTPTAKPVL